MSQSLAAALERLLAHAEEVPASRFTATQRRALDEFARRTHAVARSRKGVGDVYRAVDRSAAEAHLRSLRPVAVDALASDLPQRAANIASRRDSKAQNATHAWHYVLVKAVGVNVSWREGDAEVFDLSSATELAGVGALAIQAGDAWCSDQPLWLIENQALFDRTDWLPPQTRATLLYYGGQIPERLLDWLGNTQRAPRIMHFPDYDGVGLLNYARLLERTKTPCSFWLMPNWEALLKKYGSTALWQATHPQFMAAVERLSSLAVPREVRELCEVLSREGRGLEHEAIWLGAAEKC